MLYTLGDLALKDAAFKRQKPLLLLAYLTLEGRKERRYIAELFWPEASHGLTSLSVALSQLRKVMPDAVLADESYVSSQISSDTQELLELLNSANYLEAVALYKGEFLAGLQLKLGTELEEWIWQTREYLAERVQGVLLDLAEKALEQDLSEKSTEYAETAYKVASTNDFDPETLQRFYTLFFFSSSPKLKDIKRLATDYAIELQKPKRPEVKHKEIPSLSLPALPSALIGRDPELLNMSQLLKKPDCRLLTVLGPGGIGKTKLSLHLAHDLLAQKHFRDGIYFMALDAISSADFLLVEIVKTFNFEIPNQDLKQTLLNHFATKDCLLILDNFEHLLEASPFLSELLSACPRLKLLVTSRERLNLQEEWVLTLEGLPYPSQSQETLDSSLYYDAVQFFIYQAKRNHLGFDVSGNQAEIYRLCRMVEGSPLALELAASWVASLPLKEIVTEIEQSYDFLETNIKNLASRHQSIRAAFDSSWMLLRDKEKQILTSLAVFRGGFKREAAAEVAGASLPMLANLVNKSLLRVDHTGRYTRHALLYQYMQEKLSEDPKQELVCGRHSKYYLNWLLESQAGHLEAFDSEWENLRIAWHYALKNAEFTALADVVFAFVKYFDLRSRLKQGVALFAQTSEQLAQASPYVRGRIAVARAFLYTRMGDYEKAKDLLDAGIPECEKTADDLGLQWGLSTSAMLARFTGSFTKAKNLYLHLLETEGISELLKANLYGSLGVVEEALGNYAAAKTYLLEGLAIEKKLDKKEAVVTKLLNLGTLELNTGQLAQAQHYYQESLTLAKQMGIRHSIPILFHNLANIASKQNRHGEAKSLALEALNLVQKSGERSKESGMLASLGWVSMRANQVSEAKNYIMQSLQLALELKDEPSALTALLRYAELRLKQSDKAQAYKCLQLIIRHPSALGWTRAKAKELLTTLAELNQNMPIPELYDVLSELVIE